MMSILEYLESRGVDVSNHFVRMWWIGWQHAQTMNESYDGWVDLDKEQRMAYSEIVLEYLEYCSEAERSMRNHFVENTPMAIGFTGVQGGQRNG